jgi:hypothetical protein
MWTDGRTDKWTDMTKLIGAFRDCANAPDNTNGIGIPHTQLNPPFPKYFVIILRGFQPQICDFFRRMEKSNTRQKCLF